MRAGSRIEWWAWILGIAMLGSYAAARISFESARAAGVEAFAEAAARAHSPQAPADQRQTIPATLDIDQSLWSEERISAFTGGAAAAGAVKGVLRIPALQLEVPVYSGTTDANLNRGAAHIEGTAALSATSRTGNIGIAAHRDGFFRKLKDIAIDDELHLALDGQRLRYRVVDLAIVSPHEVGVLAATDVPSVTLVTCYPFYFLGAAPQRYIVRAQLDEARADGHSTAEATGVKENLHVSNTRKEP